MDDRSPGPSVGERPEIDRDDLRFGEGSLVYRAGLAAGVLPPDGNLVRVGIALAILTWLPLLVLIAIEPASTTVPTVAFRQSYGTHARFLLAIPLLFFSETLFSRRIADVRRRLLQAQIVTPQDLPRYANAWRQAHRWWDSGGVEATLLGITVISILLGVRSDIPGGVSTWRMAADGGLSLAGWWYSLVSLPLFQFLLWRWAWRLLVWGWLVWQISRLELQLVPTHPDLSAGLGPLGVAHVDLGPLAFGNAAMLAASFAEQIRFAGATAPQFAIPAAAVIVGVTLVLIAPLLFFARKLLSVKQRGHLEYGVFAMRYARAFDRKWIRGGASAEEPLLGTADVQSLADLSNSFSIISNMRIVPISWPQLFALAISSALPMLSLILFAYPLNELIIRAVRSLVGV
jgi:hypothetical protein